MLSLFRAAVAHLTTLKTALLCSLLLLGGCSYFQFPGVYKIYVQQGNIVTEEMVEQLQTGMTRRQVRFVLGTPLVEDTFHADRWDYIWTLKDPKGETKKNLFTVYFDGDQLARFEGDYRKTPVQDTEALPTADEAAQAEETAAQAAEDTISTDQ
ncbi:outer membrane protein assembly factor BamE [Simiduia aestuariiviva]|uniref:Outer membrane protein assembly factor BamE n=1 Tax=Simiduia aestuariiviva TaxID=1510459 RepID=A0A839UI69_9GAMM|nr:outer membrane protein assembly factor BamE [Simiduia aestuariiviva]MBB3167542.1 outer membrane protein assembly factor BamE [Simiduia aestuariiviva]